MRRDQRFVLLTAAKNEARYIATTIEAVLRQTAHPIAWFIVDDGSTDATATIVAGYRDRYSFIHLRSTEGGTRCFGSKVGAIRAAFQAASALEFEYVGVLDADIELPDHDYYERILVRMDADERLGIAGGYVYEQNRPGIWKSRKANSPDAVAGAVQMFRRACYEQIGGLAALPLGGEDWLALLDATMAGWEVCAICDLPVHHHRPTSSAGGRWRGLFKLGLLDASFGSQALFEALKCARRIGERPFVLSGMIRFAGYLWWRVARGGPVLPTAKVAFLRSQQVAKVFNVFGRLHQHPTGDR